MPSKKPPIFAVKLVKTIQNILSDIRQAMAPPFVHVMEMAAGGMKSQLIFLAAKLELADRLKNGPKTTDELSREIKCDEESLYRFMRALAIFKVITEISPRKFKTTKYGRTLEQGHPKSLYPLAVLTGESFWRDPLGGLLYSIETGNASFDHIFGKGYFEYLKDEPFKFDLFSKWMDSSSNRNCPVIAEGFNFSKYKSIVDIGGGYGALLAHILKRYPNIEGTLFDLPEIVTTPKSIDDTIKERCKVIGGDFMKEVPQGSDLYIMQQIIHDWSDEVSITILKNCKEALAPNGRILVVDSVIKPGNKYDMSKLIDLQIMATCHGGKERTKEQFTHIFKESGLKLVKIHETAAVFSILEVKKA